MYNSMTPTYKLDVDYDKATSDATFEKGTF